MCGHAWYSDVAKVWLAMTVLLQTKLQGPPGVYVTWDGCSRPD